MRAISGAAAGARSGPGGTGFAPVSPGRSPLIRRTAVGAGISAAALAGAIFALQSTASGLDSLFPSDADLFLRVAGDPFGDGGAIDAPELYGDAYRYGRILFPLVAWALALGQPEWVDVSLLAVSTLGLGLGVAAAVELLRRRGVGPGAMRWLLVVPAIWMGLRGAFSEWFVLGLVLVAFLLELDGRRRWAGVVFALVLVSREVMVLALVPIILHDLRRDAGAGLARWSAVVVIPVAWHIWVWQRVGSLPVLDGSVSRREAVDYPLAGVVRAFSELGADGVLVFVAALGAVTVGVAVLVAVRAPWYPVSHAAVLVALSIVVFGPNVWRFPGEALRTMMHAQVLAGMGLVAFLSRRQTASASGG